MNSETVPARLRFGQRRIALAWGRIGWLSLFFAVIVGLVAYLVMLPLGVLILSSFFQDRPGEWSVPTLANYTQAYLDPVLLELFGNSLLFACGSVVIGLGLGVSFAWMVERTNIPLRNVAFILLPLPAAIPGMLFAIGWLLLLSPKIGLINLALKGIFRLSEAPFDIYTLGGMFFLEGLRMVPTTFLLMVAAFRGMDPALEEAAAVSGANVFVTIWRVTLRLMLPAIAAAFLYIFMSGIEAFEIPGVVGIPAKIHVFSSRIFLATHEFPRNYGLASTLAVILLLISVVGVLMYERVTKRAERFTTITGKGYRSRVMDLGPAKWIGTALILVYLFLAVALPAMILIYGSLFPFYAVPTWERLSKASLKAYSDIWQYPGIVAAFRNTIILTLLGATITVLFTSVVSWIIVRSKMPGRRLLDVLSFIPHVIPGIVLGLSLMWFYLTFRYIPIYGTIWIILVAFVTKYMSFTTRALNAAMHQIHQELEEAGHATGASWFTVFRKITLPLLLPALINGWIYVALHAMRELSAALMLYSPQSTVISTVLWTLWNEGDIAASSAVGVILISILGVITFTARWLSLRYSKL